MDSRGHGRSTRDARPYGYDLMADDVVALMDALKIPKADIVGWSDGGIIGIDLALRHKDRVGKVFAFAANTRTSGVVEDVEKNPTFAAFIARAGKEYAALSATPNEYAAFVDQISKMWSASPTGPTPSSRRSIRPSSSSTATTMKRSSPSTPNISPRPFPTPACSSCRTSAISPSCRTQTSSTSPSSISWGTNSRAHASAAVRGLVNPPRGAQRLSPRTAIRRIVPRPTPERSVTPGDDRFADLILVSKASSSGKTCRSLVNCQEKRTAARTRRCPMSE